MKRPLAVAVVGCAIGAAVILFAASRTWAEVSVDRGPLPPTSQGRTGGQLYGWLPAVGLVALAGAGALLATRGVARMLVGVLLASSGGFGVVAGVRAIIDGAPPVWPAVCALAGIAVTAAGLFAVRRSRAWPALGTRYERDAPTTATADEPASMWDAIDRGEDPTRG